MYLQGNSSHPQVFVEIYQSKHQSCNLSEICNLCRDTLPLSTTAQILNIFVSSED